MKEDAPVNSMSGVYSLNAPGHRVGPKDRAKKFYPDIDGNFTDGIPGNPGDPFYLRPEGYWNGGSDWTVDQVPDASQNYLLEDPTGKSTSDLIAEDGTVKTFLPPDSRHFILGPLVDGYVPNHGYDNYSNIGYIQKDTRQFVLLARIQGQFSANLHESGARVWDGTESQLTVYNANFTLAMAEWFRDQITAGTFTSNVPYFYSGGVPQRPQSSADCPNCPPNMFGGATPGTSSGGGFGQGTPPNLGSEQSPSQGGNEVGAGGPFPDANPNQNNQNNDTNNDTPPPPPPPPEEPTKPRGSLLAGFAAIDSAMTLDAGLTGAFMLGSAIAWIIGQLLSIGQSMVGKLVSNFTWTPSEINALNNYASQRANQIANTMSSELSNEEWERQAEQGRQRDAEAAKEANERSRQAEEELKRAEESGDQERIDRAEEAQRNAERNQERVRNNNSRNRQQRSRERRERGLNPQGGQGREKGATINDKPFSVEGLVSVKRLIREQESGTGTITAHTDSGDVTVNIGSNSDSSSTQSPSPTERTGGGRIESATTLNPTIAWLKGESIAFAGGYVRGVAENGIKSVENMFRGTNIKPTEVMNQYKVYETYDKQATEARHQKHDYWFNTASPAINNLLSQVRANLAAPGEYTWSDFYRDRALLDKADTYFAESDRLERVAMNLINKRQSASDALGRYIMYGRLLTPQEKDPFSLDDPNVGSEKEKKDKDKQIQDQIDKLMQDNRELAQAQALNKLKALGWGALLAGGFIVGAAVLAKPAIVGALGAGTVRLLRSAVKSKTPLKPKPQYPTTPKKPTDPRFRIDEPLNPSGKNMGRPQPSRGTGMGDTWEGPLLNSYEPNRRKRLLSEIRKPVKVKEPPTKYKMNFSGKYSSQNTPDKTASQVSDNLVAKANERGNRWRMDDKNWSGYETTEKMNIIHDRVGHGSQYWDRMLDEAKEKNNWRSREVQEELNKIAHEKAMLKENPDFRSPFGNLNIDTAPTTPKNKKNFDAVTRIKNMAADKSTQKMMSQITPEYPSKPPTVPDEVTGLHPKLKSGENASAYYKRLDPTSADSMPDASYPQIDNFRDKAKKKPK